MSDGPWILAVAGDPRPQARPRHRRGQRHHFSPKTGWWHGMVSVFAQSWKDAPLDGPLRLDVEFVFPRPKSAGKAAFWKSTRPDLDNLVKGVCDALMEGGVVAEDGRICQTFQQKVLAGPWEPCGMILQLSRVDGAPGDAARLFTPGLFRSAI